MTAKGEITKSGLKGVRGVSREFLRIQYSAVYAIGPKDHGRPVKVGYAGNIFERFANIQSGAWVPLSVHYLVWTGGRPVAVRLEAEAHRLLDAAGRRIRGEWFDVSHELARDAIHVAAQNLKLPIFSHGEMLRRCEYAQEMEFKSIFSPHFGGSAR